jgi:hypothetical protein
MSAPRRESCHVEMWPERRRASSKCRAEPASSVRHAAGAKRRAINATRAESNSRKRVWACGNTITLRTRASPASNTSA